MLNRMVLVGVMCFSCVTGLWAEEAKKAEPPAEDIVALSVGDRAPMFKGMDDRGEPWQSRDYAGKKILAVYFFPAAMTGG